MPNFIEDYLEFQSGGESPTIYHRWSAIAGIGALLGRNCWVEHGHNKIYPNQYIMIVGESGARKDTAIKAMRRMLKSINYNYFVADKSSKEKFLMDLEIGMDKMDDEENDNKSLDVSKGEKKNPTMRELFGSTAELDFTPKEAFIVAGELNVFLGQNNTDFITALTDLWDYDDVYKSRLKNSKSVRIPYPTINLLGGNTNLGISMAFPPEIIGTGFFSRLIMVYSDPTGRRITRPPALDVKKYEELLFRLIGIKEKCAGHIEITDIAWERIDTIYQEWVDLEDVRFKSYSTRRFMHLLKLCTICAAAKEENIVSPETVEYANSILHYTEFWMPKALGEFGKAKNSDVVAKIVELLDKAENPLKPMEDIWPQVQRDLDNQRQLQEILMGLLAGGKIQNVGGAGFLPVKKQQKFSFPFCRVEGLKEFQELQGKDRM